MKIDKAGKFFAKLATYIFAVLALLFIGGYFQSISPAPSVNNILFALCCTIVVMFFGGFAFLTELK